MKNILKKLPALAAVVVFTATASFATVQIGIPNDATNCSRALKLLESAGLITVAPEAGFYPELKDVSGHIYDVEILPASANILPSTLDDYAASTINGTYAIPMELVPSRDALILESQEGLSENPFTNVIVVRSEDRDNEIYKKILSAFQTQPVAEYLWLKYALYPAFDYDANFTPEPDFIEKIDEYTSSPKGKTVVKVGVCGAMNGFWNAAQKVLDERGENIYIELVEFDAFNLPNEALNGSDIELTAFQHLAYLNKEVSAFGYKIEPIGSAYFGPLGLYSRKVKTLDELKALAGKN